MAGRTSIVVQSRARKDRFSQTFNKLDFVKRVLNAFRGEASLQTQVIVIGSCIQRRDYRRVGREAPCRSASTVVPESYANLLSTSRTARDEQWIAIPGYQGSQFG